MASVSIRFNNRQTVQRYRELSRKIKDFKEPLNDTGDDLLGFFGGKVFSSQGTESTGIKWKSLAPATLYMRAKRFGHYAKKPITTSKILIWTGALKKGFTKDVSKTILKISNGVEYFKYNQPAREMLTINRKVLEIVAKNFNRWINKITR